MKKILVVVDMQNDFISGALGSPAARKIVPAVARKINERRSQGYGIVFTMDTHGKDYLSTAEGRALPVEHCIKGSYGWRLCEEISAAAEGCETFEKGAFGSRALIAYLEKIHPDEIEFIGLCTDICVISNAITAKTFLPETTITVDGSCCAGSTEEGHAAALSAMRSCQIKII